MDKKKIFDRLIEQGFLSVRPDKDIEYSKEFKEYVKKGQELLMLEIKDPVLFVGFAEGDFKDEEKATRKLNIRLFTWLYFCFENEHDPLKRNLQKTIWDKRHEAESLEGIMGLVACHDAFGEEGEKE